MPLIAKLQLELLRQRGHLLPWIPVCLGAGVAMYFGLPGEPGFVQLAGLMGIASVLAVTARFAGAAIGPVIIGTALLTVGVVLGAARAHIVDAPVLKGRYYGTIEGRIINIDRSASDALRLTLGDVRIDRAGPVPRRVRVALHGPQRFLDPKSNLHVALTGHLTPPSGPAEPGGFDFQRHAWFQRLGAVGYTRTPVLAIAPPPDGYSIFAVRRALSQAVQTRMRGEAGAFAAAVTTGDRSAMSRQVIDDLRRSNLAHLLAISGLHMGLLAGFVFAAVRVALSLFPPLALRLPVKKLAAVAALVAATGYLLLSGGNVATERAYIMSAVALGAVMVERRAISLRAVAVAALVVIVLRPEAVTGPGFQMSFAATTALVAVFRLLSGQDNTPIPRWLRPVLAVIVSSLVAGLATAPIAAAHFNQIAHYGLIANLLSVPVMGLVVVPSAVLAACLAPLGLEGVGLWVMGLGLEWILTVAGQVADLPGARSTVQTPPFWVLPMIAFGGLWLVLWQGRARLAGLPVIALAFVVWSQAQRPEVLIAQNGKLVGVLTDQGRALSRPVGQGFVARIWLENDGDTADQKSAASRWPNGEGSEITPQIITVNSQRLIHVWGKRALAQFSGCAPGDIVVFAMDYDTRLPCVQFDSSDLGRGAIALQFGPLDADKITMLTASNGVRLWNRHDP